MPMLQIERVFNAPRELVWRAFTDPDEFSAWFGPVGYSVPRDTVDFDVRVGGQMRLLMVADDPTWPPGGPISATFDEVVEGELLASHEDLPSELAELFGTPRMNLRLEFHDHGEGQTRLVIEQGPYSQEWSGNANAGWHSSFTKLEALLAA